ncbi:MAG: ribonuclease III [candidate division WS1 bacterium]|jgi:ribonuclease-3|nr:ribonuclease III [candidate division WS1 bacterium]
MDPLLDAIGYRFRDERLLLQARTHGSYTSDAGNAQCASNQRLEFLGDAVIDLVVSEALYQAHPAWPEGQLTRARASFVSASALARVGAKLGLGVALLMGRGETRTGGRTRESTLADAVEALVGAIYLDGGMEPARGFILAHILAGREQDDAGDDVDPKTALQELIQAHGGPPPTYKLLDSHGPSHAPTFRVEVLVGGLGAGCGEGTSKRAAERAAAAEALLRADLLSLIPEEPC